MLTPSIKERETEIKRILDNFSINEEVVINRWDLIVNVINEFDTQYYGRYKKSITTLLDESMLKNYGFISWKGNYYSIP